MKAVPIAINLICLTDKSQSRARTDRCTVEEYAQAWRLDADFPPVDLFTEGIVYYPGDGMHRILAAKLAGRAAILAYVYRGDEREAFLHGCASNQTHGLRRSNSDKRHMVSRMLNDMEWVKWSDRRIAHQCGVSAQFVANIRNELSTVDSSPARRHADKPRLGADGKMRKPPTANDGKQRSITVSHSRQSQISLTTGIFWASTNTERNGDLSSQRQEATVLLDRLKHILMTLDIYDCCALELQSISDKVRQQGAAEMSA